MHACNINFKAFAEAGWERLARRGGAGGSVTGQDRAAAQAWCLMAECVSEHGQNRQGR